MVKTMISISNNKNINNKSYSFTFNEIKLIIDKVKAKTLFEEGHTAAHIQKTLTNSNYSLKTLYNWKNTSCNVEDIQGAAKIPGHF